jgi:hypothetical protein
VTETKELSDFIQRSVYALDGIRESLDAFDNGDCREDFAGISNEWTQEVVSYLQMTQVKLVNLIKAAQLELGEATIAAAGESVRD